MTERIRKSLQDRSAQLSQLWASIRQLWSLGRSKVERPFWLTPSHIAKILAPILLIWEAVWLLVFLTGATLDSKPLDFATVACAASVHVVLFCVILRRNPMSRLVASLLAFIGIKAVFWFYLVSFEFWPVFTASFVHLPKTIEILINVTGIWAIVEILRTPEPIKIIKPTERALDVSAERN